MLAQEGLRITAYRITHLDNIGPDPEPNRQA